MLRRFSVNYAALTMVLDMGVTLLALTLAVSLRPHLPRVPLLVPLFEITLPTWIYVVIPLLWFLAFLIASVYDPKHTYRLVDELQAVSLGSLLAALLCAGLFFLIFREFSRWLFFTFLAINVSLLISWRLVARLLWRLSSVPAADRRVLIVGAGILGQRVAQMIEEYKWTGLSLIGYLDDSFEEGRGRRTKDETISRFWAG